MLKESNTIEEAIIKIVKNLKFVNQVIQRFQLSSNKVEFFYSLYKNYAIGISDYKVFSLKNLEIILNLDPQSLSMKLAEKILSKMSLEIILR